MFQQVNSMAYWKAASRCPVDNKIPRIFVWMLHVQAPALDIALTIKIVVGRVVR